MKHIKEKNIIGFGLDMLEVFWTFEKIESISNSFENEDENSQVKYYRDLVKLERLWLQDFILEKRERFEWYQYAIFFIYKNEKVFAYSKWDPDKSIPSYDLFIVYWLWFLLMKQETIFKFIEENIKWKDDVLKIRRMDLALDLNVQIEKLKKKIKKIRQATDLKKGQKWEIETYSIWRYQKADNKRLFIRFYNKILELKKWTKQLYYTDYLKLPIVSRLELEFRVELTKRLSFEKIKDDKYLFNLFIAHMNKYTDIFDKLKTMEVEKLKTVKNKTNIEELKLNQIKSDAFVYTFLWYPKSLFLIWRCPINEMIMNWIVWDEFKRKYKIITGKDFDITKYKSIPIPWSFESKKDIIMKNEKTKDNIINKRSKKLYDFTKQVFSKS